MARKYVPVFFDWKETTADLDQDQKGDLIDAIVDYASVARGESEIIAGLAPIVRVAFRFMKGQVDRNDEISAARSRAGSNKPEQTPTNDNKKEQTPTKPAKEPETEPKPTVKRFVPPTYDEVAAYCRERNNKVDPQCFLDFYASKGWKVGNQPMKDWRACIRTWEKRTGGSSGKNDARDVHGYNQRDYSGEQKKALERMMADGWGDEKES